MTRLSPSRALTYIALSIAAFVSIFLFSGC